MAKKLTTVDRFTLITAAIGCVTGIASLAWQIWDTSKPVQESITASFDARLNRQTGGVWIETKVVNMGKAEAYINEARFAWFGQSEISITGEQPDFPLNEPRLAAGEYRVLKSREVPYDQVKRLTGSRSQTLGVRIATTRGFKFTSGNLVEDIAYQQAIYEAVFKPETNAPTTRNAQ